MIIYLNCAPSSFTGSCPASGTPISGLQYQLSNSHGDGMDKKLKKIWRVGSKLSFKCVDDKMQLSVYYSVVSTTTWLKCYNVNDVRLYATLNVQCSAHPWVRPKWIRMPYGPWSSVVHYIVDRVPFSTHPIHLCLSPSLSNVYVTT